MIIDSHVNLHGPQYADDLADVLARARAAGVGGMLAICDRLENVPAIAGIVAGQADLWRSVGVHPHHAKDFVHLTPQDLIDLAADDPQVIAIGETGLDQYYGHSTLDDQIKVLRTHIAAARTLGLPVIIHTRDADEATAHVLEDEYAKGPVTFLMHCYTSGPELARRAAAIGAYFSVSGILTFKAADSVRAVARDMPLERMIVETDCPYLAPVPMRGRRNEPAFVRHVLQAFADLRGLSLGDAERLTTDAFFNLFGRAQRPVVTA